MLRGPRVIAVLALLAVLIDLGSFHGLHNGDTIVPILISLYQWTPFFWEEDRYGMGVALLATPFANPLHNLLVQTAITSFLLLLAFFAIARYVVGRAAWVTAGATGALLFLALQPEAIRFDYLGTSQQYGTALALGASGLVLLAPEEGRSLLGRLAGAALVVAAVWVNGALPVALAPVVLLRALLAPQSRPAAAEPAAQEVTRQQRRKAARAGLDPAAAERPMPLRRVAALALRAARSEAGIALAVLGAAFISMRLATAGSAYKHPYELLPVREWPACWAALWKNAADAFLHRGYLLALGAFAALGVGGLVAARRAAALRAALATTLPLFAGALASFAIVGTVTWVKLQEFSARYAFPSLIFVEVALVGFGLAPLLALLSARRRRAVEVLALGALGIAILALYGPPAPGRIRADIDRTLGGRTAEVLEAGCTHVVGTYWNVWPTVFHANLVLHGSGGARKVWGVTQRSVPTADRWARIPLDQMRLAAALDDAEVPKWLRVYGFPPMTEVARLRTIAVLRPAASVAQRKAPDAAR